VEYNANGGTGSPATQEKWHNTTLKLSEIIPTRQGYTFLGWSESGAATIAAYTAGGNYTSNTGATLYAVWKADKLYTQTTVTKDTSYNFNIKVFNSPDNAVLVLAAYNSERKLTEIKTAPLNSATQSVTLTMNNNIGAANAKVMIWNGLNMLEPMCDYETISTLP
jgi:uncharacterized repeat protein (TIGR02543 family)